jgi:hypothetical protein
MEVEESRKTNADSAQTTTKPPPPPLLQQGKPPPPPLPPPTSKPCPYIDRFKKKQEDDATVIHTNHGRQFSLTRPFKTFLDFLVPNAKTLADAAAALTPLIAVIQDEFPDSVFYPCKLQNSTFKAMTGTEVPTTGAALEKLFHLQFFPTNRKDWSRNGLFYLGTESEVDRYQIARIRTFGLNPQRWSLTL